MGIRELTIYPCRKEAARNLRQANTYAEAKLWSGLRNRGLGGYKFRRQFPIGPFFADFCCLEKRLIIEVDGHVHKQTVDADDNRSRFLEEKGFRILRFTNQEVMTRIDMVFQRILQSL